MAMVTRRSARLAVLAAFVLGAASVAVPRVQAAPGGAAGEVLRLWGRDRGLCSVVGVGDAASSQLAVDLASTGTVLVHALAFDAAGLADARGAVTTRGLDGYATVEVLPLDPMPYRDNLVNLMVVPDMAAAAAVGFVEPEALRAVAPLGTLCLFEEGQWRVTRKPVQPGMDEWTHNVHGPDGNRVSKDTVVRFPVGYRWHAGLPFNINNVKRTGNRYAATRGLAMVGGRCFTFSDSVVENLRGAYFLGQGMDQYVTARDAFSGLFLWRRRIGRVYYGGLWYTNLAPFAVVDDVVCTSSESGDLLMLDAATGKEIRTVDTAFAPGDLVVDRGVVAVATWQGGTWLGESRVNRYERRRMHSAVADGAVEAYDLATGKRLWKREALATSLRTADGVLFLAQRDGPDLLEESRRFKTSEEKKALEELKKSGKPLPAAPARPGQGVVALDLKTGRELWQVAAAALAPEDHGKDALRLDAVGQGVVTVIHAEDIRSGRVSVLSARDGRIVLQAKSGQFPVLRDNALHLNGKAHSLTTGAESGRSPYSIGSTVCTPSFVVNDIIVRNRGGGFSVDGKGVTYAGARGGCGMASAPAYGAFYTPQNWCTCCPPQISGFICFGPIRGVPTAEQMAAAAAVVRGPAYSADKAAAVEAAPAWPMVRCNAARSSGTRAATPASLRLAWRRDVPSPALDQPVALNWREYLNPPLVGPSVADGVVVAAVVDANQVVGLDLTDGSVLWHFTAGGRIDSAPTLYRGLCLFGAHDGLVYVLEAATGRLCWKMRLAPNDERMVSYGKVESPWPVVGSILVAGDKAYASAGRTQGSDGGIVVRALEPGSGETLWSKALASTGSVRELRRNDVLFKVDDAIQMMTSRLDLGTGETRPNLTRETNAYNSSSSRLKRDLGKYRKQLAAEADDEALAKRVADLAERLAALVEPESETALALGASGTGSEGLVHWNWPQLGDRKYRRMNYGNVSGYLVSWDDAVVCAMTRDRTVTLRAMGTVGKAGEKLGGKPLWTVSLAGDRQITSLVVCSNAVVASGGVYSRAEDGAVTARGFVVVLSRETGETVADHELPAPVAYNGLAALETQICVALTDSSVVLLGE